MKKGLFQLHLMLLLIGGTLPASVWAQVKNAKPTVKRAAKPTSTPQFSQTPFSPSIAAVPVGYVGHDVKQIYKWLAARSKGTAITANQTIYGQIKVGSTLAFAQKVGETSAYNAQKGLYDANIFIDHMINSQNMNDLKNRRRIKANWEIVSTSTYPSPKIGEVLKSVVVQHDLLLEGWAALPLDRGEMGMNAIAHITFPLSSEEAKAAQGNINALYIYNLKQPYTSKIFQRESPTKEFPMETDNNYWNLHGDIQQIWLYNAKTGKIYQKLAPTPSVDVDDKFDKLTFKPYSVGSGNYLGHDVETIYRLLEQNPKDVPITANQPLYGSLKVGSTLAFSKKIEGSVIHEATTGVIKVKMMPDIEPNQPDGLEDLNRRRVRVRATPANTSTYSLPDIPKVTKTTMTEYNLSLDGWDSMPLDYESQSPYIVLPLTKEQAQPIIGQLSALYIYTLKAPYTTKAVVKSSAPKPLFPVESETTYYSLRGDIKEVWIYNDKTGKIYRKIVAPA